MLLIPNEADPATPTTAIVPAIRQGPTSSQRPLSPPAPRVRSDHVNITASRRHMTSVPTAPARATSNQRFGAEPPNSEKTVVKITGIGFHDGPYCVLNCP